MSPCIPHYETFEFLKESVYTYHEVPQICSKLVLFNFIFFLFFSIMLKVLQTIPLLCYDWPFISHFIRQIQMEIKDDTLDAIMNIHVNEIRNCCKKLQRDEFFEKLNNYLRNNALTIEVSTTKFLDTCISFSDEQQNQQHHETPKCLTDINETLTFVIDNQTNFIKNLSLLCYHSSKIVTLCFTKVRTSQNLANLASFDKLFDNIFQI